MEQYIDELHIVFGDEYPVNDYITMKQPTIGQIISIGEEEYFNVLHTLCAIPSDMKSQLWDLGIDYEKMEDLELFSQLTPTIQKEFTKLFFTEEIDFSKLVPSVKKDSGDLVLFDYDSGLILDNYAYLQIVSYLRKLHGMEAKIELAGNESTKQLLIEVHRQDREMSKDKPFKSFFAPLIVSMVNTEEFKYNYQTIRDLNIGAFMASVKQIQRKKNVMALLQGCYSGMIDTSKIKSKELTWIGSDE